MPDYRNGYAAQEILGRRVADEIGQELGQKLVAEMEGYVEEKIGDDPDYDPYLEYLIWQSAAQEITNWGRRIGGIDHGRRDNELEGKKGKA